MGTKVLLTFELIPSGDVVEIHANKEGLAQLIEMLQRVLQHGGHDHLMTPSWGGWELSEEKQGEDSTLINHVKIILWK